MSRWSRLRAAGTSKFQRTGRLWNRKSPNKGPRLVTEILPEAGWWEAFENDELSWFIGMALRKNHNVREAAFRVLEGEGEYRIVRCLIIPSV